MNQLVGGGAFDAADSADSELQISESCHTRLFKVNRGYFKRLNLSEESVFHFELLELSETEQALLGFIADVIQANIPSETFK